MRADERLDPGDLKPVRGGLVADRFLVCRDGLLDLASGVFVEVRVLPAAGPAAHRAWLDRLGTLAGLWHPHLLTPLDYGVLPGGQRFEARPVTTRAPGALRAERAAVFASAAGFLAAQALTAGRADPRRVGDCGGRLVLVTDDRTGCPLASGDVGTGGVPRPGPRRQPPGLRPATPGPRPPVVGVRLQPRAALSWITDVLDAVRPGVPRSIRLRAPRGSGVDTLLRALAAEARRRGFVPVDACVAARRPEVLPLLEERHALVIDRARCAQEAAGLLVRLSLSGARGHVLLSCLDAAGEGGGALDIDPLPAARLVQMVTCDPPRDPADLMALAERAGGNPGRFLELLAGAGDRRARPPAAALVREVAPAYAPAAAENDGASRAGPSPDLRLGQSPARVASLTQRGRWAAAIRLWRATLSAHERRGDEARAAEAALALAGMLADRGRWQEAGALFRRAARSDPAHVRARAAAGLARTLVDEGRLVEAEAAARTALVAAGAIDEGESAALARLALARVLFWQGHFRDAARELGAPFEAGSPLESARLRRLARARLALGDVAGAARTAAAAHEVARQRGDPRDLAATHALLARLAAGLDDAVGVRAHLADGLRWSARAGLLSSALQVRLAVAEGAYAAARHEEARRLARRLAPRAARAAPLVRARVEAVLAAAGDPDAETAVSRFIEASGARGLAPRAREDVDMEVAHEAAELMRVCQDADDTAAALAGVCRTLAERLRARTVTVVARGHGAAATLATAGPTWALADRLAERALDGGIAVRPQASPGGVEGAVPVRYAGRTIGAVVCRWPVDAGCDAARAMALLTAAATACAPAVQAEIDTRLAPPPAAETSRAVPALIGDSPAIEAVRQMVLRAAAAPFAVLVEGESGSGKELVARAIHELGPRRGYGFCAVNCAALGDDLLEAELFGHAKGAFTGAISERAGLFEEADRGTLFLDEVSELSPRAQAKLLRAIQEGEVRRLGENLPRRVDVRLVAASNRSLEGEVARGRFRADLRYRLDVLRIAVPPLRDHPDDVPRLAAHFWQQATARTGSRAVLTSDALAALARYDWPGNVRELQNVLASLAVGCGPRGRVGAAALPAHLAGAAGARITVRLDEARLSFERRFVRAALARAGGHRGRAARALGVTRQGLAKLLKRLEIDPGDLAAGAGLVAAVAAWLG